MFCSLCFIFIDYSQYKKREKIRKEQLNSHDLIYTQINHFTNQDIIEHDIQIILEQYNQQFQMNCDLQDYIARWCHEVKLPLSALLLMNEKISNQQLRTSSKEQLERIRQQLNAALIGCKVQSNLYDLQIKETSLKNCITTSIKNNQYFLIQKHFEIEIQNLEDTVYTDKEWLVYVLDQLISNTIKYCERTPKLKISSNKNNQIINLFIEDNGFGIKESDIRHIFERGFTGSNHHNGEYKSTGMGLYFASLIIQKLGHSLSVESEYGKYTKFTISFQDHRDYFQL